MIEKTKLFIAERIDRMIMAFGTARMLWLKRGDMPTDKIITLGLILIALVVLFVLYKMWTPNPARVAGCFTDVTGPFT